MIPLNNHHQPINYELNNHNYIHFAVPTHKFIWQWLNDLKISTITKNPFKDSKVPNKITDGEGRDRQERERLNGNTLMAQLVK